MTKEELNQLNDLKAEIKELEQKITVLKQKEIGKVQDKVKSSSKYFPYIQGSTTIEGFDNKEAEHRDSLRYKKEMLLISRKTKAEQEEIKLMQYISSISDSKVRRIMQYKYVDGYSWEKIGNILHCDRTTVQKIVTRYLENHN